MSVDSADSRVNEDSLFFTAAVTPEALRQAEKTLVPTIQDISRKIAKARSPRLCLVGGGASLSSSFCGKYLFNRFTDVPADAVNGWQLLSGIPNSLGPDTFLVATSYSGETPEVLTCVEQARQRGAITIAITNTADTPLAKACSYVLDYHTKAVFTIPVALLYWLAAHAMISRKENAEEGKRIIDQMGRLPEQMEKLYRDTRQTGKEFARRFKDETGFYVLASGPTYGLGYKLALSVVIENLWIDGCPIEAGDFYHGPIEIVPPNDRTRQTMAFLHLVGTDPSRQASEQAIAFCRKHNVRQLVFDAKDYPDFGELFSPFALFVPTEWFVMYMCAFKNHDVDERRYMGKIASRWGEYGSAI